MHAGQGLDPALGLFGFGGLGFEAVDKALQPSGFAGLALVGNLALLHPFGALCQKVVIAAFVAYELALVHVQNRTRHGIQKFGIVRNQQHRAGIRHQPALQPEHGVQVQVVCRLVQ